MSKQIFIDGSAGTTGLRIRQRLAGREGIRLIELPEELRKDPDTRRQAFQQADAAFLCLPDDAARQAVQLAEGSGCVLLDASTAHRTAPGWVYGMPELGRRQAICQAKRIAVPGCHASGFIALVAPLVQAGLLLPEAQLYCCSLTGYSGGGKSMIAQYEAADRSPLLDAPRQYGLGQSHKHLPEMAAVTGLDQPPVFSPIVGDFYSGMEVTVPLFASQLTGGAGMEQVKALYKEVYAGPMIRYTEAGDESGFLSAGAYTGRDSMEISVSGNDQRMLLVARYDNLGKGASGAAVQCMNLALGFEETEGLEL